MATWLGGWLGVCHSRYCIKTTKPICKLFGPSGSPIIEAFGTPCADTKFQGAFNTRGWKKLAIFDGYCRLSRKRCENYIDIGHKRLVNLSLLLNERNFLIRVLYKDCY